MSSLAVIIINWNTRDITDACIASLCAARGIERIIVADNNSSDGSVPFLRDKYPQVHFIENRENYGYAKACNIALRQTTEDFVAIINSDTEVFPDTFELLLKRMNEDKSIGLIGPMLLYPDLSFQDSCRGFPTLWYAFTEAFWLHSIFRKSKVFNIEAKYLDALDRPSYVEVVVGAFFIVRREALAKVGELDEDFFFYAEDVDYCKRMKTAGWEVAYEPAAKVIHKIGKSSEKNRKKYYLQQIAANVLYWQKHHGTNTRRIYLVLRLTREIIGSIVSVVSGRFQDAGFRLSGMAAMLKHFR